MRNAGLLSIIILVGFVFWCPVLAYATITEQQALSFGVFALRDNAAAYDMVVSPTGSVSNHASYVMISPGQNAVFDLTDLPPDTLLGVSIGDISLSPDAGGGPSFDAVDFTFSPANPVTDVSGAVTINVGGTLRTSGSGAMYSDAAFSGSATLQVIF